MKCPSCERENLDDSRVCEHCGAPLEEGNNLRQALERIIHGQATSEDVQLLQRAIVAGEILTSEGRPISGDIIKTGNITDSVGVAIGRGAKAYVVQLDREALRLLLPHPPPFMAEEPPDDFVLRTEETEKLLGALLPKTGTGEADGVVHEVALFGAGGFGKTALAQYICHRPEVKEAYSDGILWVTLGQKADVLGGLIKLYAALTGERPAFVDVEDAASSLATQMGDKHCLLVIDDVWDQTHLKPFLRAGAHTTFLITTRNINTLLSGVRRIDVDAMRQAEAVSLLSTGLPLNGYKLKFQNLAARLGEWPLLLKLANGVLHSRIKDANQPIDRALEYIGQALKRRGLKAFDVRDAHEHGQAVGITLDLSLSQLRDDERDRYNELVVFPEDVDVPLDTVGLLWKYIGGLDSFETEELCQNLFGLSLLLRLDLSKRTIRLHDVMRAYLFGINKDKLPTLHYRLIEAFRAEIPSLENKEGPAWHAGPDDGYFFQFLPYHFSQAGRVENVKDLFLDFLWLRAKLDATDVNTLFGDYSILDLVQEQNRPFALIQSALQLSAHVLSQDKSQLAAQLMGRLLDFDLTETQSLLDSVNTHQDASWLRPLTANLLPPGSGLVRTLQGHAKEIGAVTITPDGNHIISASWDNTLKVWEVSTGQEVRTLKGHTSDVNAVAITPDGKHVVSGSHDRTIKVWEIASGREVHTLQGHSEGISAVAVTPDGQHIISGSYDSTIKVWELASGQEVRTLEGRGHWLNAFVVTPDGQHMIVGFDDGTINILEVASGREVNTLRGHGEGVSALAVTPDVQYIISGSHDNSLKVWEVTTAQEVCTLEGHSDVVLAVAVTPDGQYIVSGSDDAKLKMWEVADWREVRTFEMPGDGANATAVTPDGQYIITGSYDGNLRIWKIARDIEFHSLGANWLQGHTSLVSAVVVTPDGQHAVSGSYDYTLKVWEVGSGRELRTLRGHTALVMAVAVTPDGKHIISGSENGTLKVWDVASGQEVCTLRGHISEVSALVVTPDGKHIISGASDSTLKVWELASGREVHALRGHSDRVNIVVITPDGKKIISGSWDSTLRVWEVASGRNICTIEGQSVGSIVVTPDGKHIISGASDSALKVWGLARCQEVRAFGEHSDGLNVFAVTSDGKLIILGGSDNTLKVWELASGHEVCALVGHRQWITAVAVKPDGKYIVSSSRDATLKVWEIPSGKCISTFQVECSLMDCVISPDGNTVVAGDEAGRVHFFRLEGF
jgi:WD40 repeat protein